MAHSKTPQTEFHHGKKPEITIKQINIDENKTSTRMTYRRDNKGNIIVTGFNVKTYGDTTRQIKSKNDSLIRYGIERMNNPMMKDDKSN